MRRYCNGLMRTLDVSGCAITVVFIGLGKMRDLNRKYRGMDRATDVLSFGYPGERVHGFLFLGEIVIAPEMAQRQAIRWRTTMDRELRKLLVHGILHLLGYDHEADSGEMNALQRSLLRRRIPGAHVSLAAPNGEP